MKRILGLDLGTNSIGWALVNEDETPENSRIIKLGVRIVQYDNYGAKDPVADFAAGKSLSPNADRTKYRGMRRRLNRYQDRRNHLRKILLQHNIINENTILCEDGKNTTFETLRLRALAATEEIGLEQFARVLFAINKKRGYKSNRKEKNTDEGAIIDGMDIAKYLYENDLTPGQVCYERLSQGIKRLPEFYASDLRNEMRKIWDTQAVFHGISLSQELWEEIQGKNSKATWAICAPKWNLVGIKRTVKGHEQKVENYKWRVEALNKQLDLEQLIIVLQDINAQISGASGYLGNISDRSKELYFKNQTIGQYKYASLCENPHASLRGKAFFRQDYLNEFERIWETQAQYHKELTPELKEEIRNTVIFYQRKLKSQKGLKGVCELEGKVEKKMVDGKEKMVLVGPAVCPLSSPLFQESKIRQVLNNIVIRKDATDKGFALTAEERECLFQEANLRKELSASAALKMLYGKSSKGWSMNYDAIPGNTTNAALYECYRQIIDISGHGEYDFDKMPANEIHEVVDGVLKGLEIDTRILDFKTTLPMKELINQPSYQLWHLLYSYVPNDTTSAIDTLHLEELLTSKFNFAPEYAKIMSKVSFANDYGSLSAKAICNIMPHLINGEKYSDACALAGYNHSAASITKEENESRELADRLQLLPKNSLRNPMVEKILNQMVNVVNSVIDEYGKIDEVRIELARDLKNSAGKRKEISEGINKATKENEQLKKEILSHFPNMTISKNDLIRFKLYKELQPNGFKTLYSNTYIPVEQVFDNKFEIEHIVPKALLFNDSLSNKTLETHAANQDKSNMTAFDFMASKGEKALNDYESAVKELHSKNAITKGKMNLLLMKQSEIPSDFLNRDLNETQYIARKAKEMLLSIVRNVVSTTGSVTSRLREDWQLVDVMKELNWNKYDALGRTEQIKTRDGKIINRIKDWTKRDDHRHHAMDALTISFTHSAIIQYLNNLNARSDKAGAIYAIEKSRLYRDNNGKLRFIPPMPLNVFRQEAKRNLENILISFKAKNTVVTNNVNRIKAKNGEYKIQHTQTPRGQLHNETIYGRITVPVVTVEKIGKNFTEEKIATVCCPKYREALLARLAECGGDTKKAFTGKNDLSKNPIWLDSLQLEKVPSEVKCKTFESRFTIRKAISKDLSLDKIVDAKIKAILLQRLAEYGNNAEKAFSNLEESPIWLNREKGIAIKTVTIFAVNNADPLHDYKCDHHGNPILDEDGNGTPCDYVQTSNNHHAALYIDADGNVQEQIVPLFEAVARANAKMPIVDTEFNASLGWKFLFSIKKNECFVFPNPATGFNPKEIDFNDPNNYQQISQNLFRVQKFTTKDYVFRHHLETTLKNDIKDITFKRITRISLMTETVKVRINHAGKIVKVNVD